MVRPHDAANIVFAFQMHDSLLSSFATELVLLFRQNQRKRRTILPLLKTLEKLINSGCLNGIIQVKESSFCVDLLECLMAEANRCTNVSTLLALISVSLGILSSFHAQEVREIEASWLLQ